MCEGSRGGDEETGFEFEFSTSQAQRRQSFDLGARGSC